MSISEQEAAGDFISIKQIWLRQIDRCNELLTNYNLKGQYSESGVTAAISSVHVLIMNLVDYGDSPLKSEFNEWLESNKSKLKEESRFAVANLKFEKVILILNKYQMLHDSLPRGYTNVVMEGVKKEVKKE